MIRIIAKKITPGQIKEVSEDLEDYIKFVVDIKKGILAAGGEKHVECEEVLLTNGSKQADLWGGGWDLETNELDYDSMINIRPAVGNNSREVLSEEIRNKMKEIVNSLLR